MMISIPPPLPPYILSLPQPYFVNKYQPVRETIFKQEF